MDNTLNEQVKEALKKVGLSRRNTKQYRIHNKDGLIYSQHLGWVEPTNDVYGHLFNQKELSIVIAVLKANGYTDVYSELDKTGTLFVAAVDSPFGNESKMGSLLLFTVFCFGAAFLIIKTNISDWIAASLNK